LKLLLDAMWPPFVAQQLRVRGHDVVCVVEVSDLRTESDEAVYEYAQRENRVLVTEDSRGFRVQAAESLRAGSSHVGLILTSPRSFPRDVPRTHGMVVRALDALLTSGVEIDGREFWLRPL
jgi:predicted nuclease of predicted toxin-antitoxin system